MRESFGMETEFLLTALIVVLLPGTGVLYTLATGLGLGTRASAVAAFGCTLGILPQLLLSTFGLSAIFHASGFAFQIIKIAGALYLLFMAWQVLQESGALQLQANDAPRSNSQLIGTGIWLNLLNPKLGLFFLAFLPQFVPADTDNAKAIFFVLGLVFVAMTLVIFIGYGLLASWVRNYVISKPQVMKCIRWGFAAAFVFLGLRLGFETV
ncbi:LysE family translocator [Paraburkholderia denitrificans]|uniref:LysE family translocator n=1 Tax=Paraburkholderia denitrificans TaxID=694025 RepID=A0ABW0J924_9BURK